MALAIFSPPLDQFEAIFVGERKILQGTKKGEKMENAEKKDIILFVPRSNLLTAVLVGFISLFIGLAFPFLVGWQLLTFGVSLLFIIGGLWLGSVLAWKLLHRPVLIVNSEGICSQHPMFGTKIRWEEMDAVYRINAKNGGAFAVDISPAGLVAFLSRQSKRLPKGRDLAGPQLALGIPAANLPIPVDELLAQIRERFAEQIERYHIDCSAD